MENIQYSLFASYIKYASEKLVVKECEIMTQSEMLLDKMS